ncbi:MAG: aminopeptidase [Anaerolineales bacterium]
MQDLRMTQLARLIVEHSARVKENEQVGIMGWPEALPLMEALYEAVLEREGHPVILLDYALNDELLLKKGSPAQLAYVPPLHRLAFETFDALFKIRSESNTRTLSGVDPNRQTQRRAAIRPILNAQMQRGASGALKWVVTQFPNAAYAQDAEMSLREYEDFVFGACHVNGEADPVSFWKKTEAEQQRLVDYLKGHDRVKVISANCDLMLSIKGRTFLNAAGHHNMPDGEIYTGPVEDSVNGWVRYSYPAVSQGREVEGVEFTFERGRVVKATAKKNEAFLLKTLDTDPGARYVGEFAIGTNFGVTRPTKNILFDEKIGGTIHMAVGAGYPETGSVNASAVHWDMLCDMRSGGEIWVDGELYYQNGEFKV